MAEAENVPSASTAAEKLRPWLFPFLQSFRV